MDRFHRRRLAGLATREVGQENSIPSHCVNLSMTTSATFRLSSDELDANFLDKVKSLFAHREVEIIVREPAMDETEYLLGNPHTRERLLDSIANIREGKNLVELDRSTFQ